MPYRFVEFAYYPEALFKVVKIRLISEICKHIKLKAFRTGKIHFNNNNAVQRSDREEKILTPSEPNVNFYLNSKSF